MDPFDSHLDEAYEHLNKAIMKAIVSSEDVRNVLTGFKEKDMINHLSVLNLILSLEELSDMVFADEDSSDYESVIEDLGTEKPGKSSEMEATNPFKIDGQNLTPNEILFEKFFQKKFSAQEWLKKAKIKQ
ncbi:MAG: hypothetical protein IIB46_04035 [Nitrospinae bacterium]|nr:hypothetical protein [Nitrospinota bacterium]